MMSSREPLVSVVTPFHNTAPYLQECIKSVLAQSHRNLEYILHDNASTDESVEIAHRYAATDQRIRYIRHDNLLPQVPNYNKALEAIDSSSAYCKVVQADDWIDAQCIERMVRLAEAAPRVGIVSSYYLEETEVRCTGLPYTETVCNGREVARQHLLGTYFLFGTPTTVLYRSEIVHSRRPFYREGRYHEDTEACYEILRDWDFGFVHQVLSFSRAQAGSIHGEMRKLDTEALDGLICLIAYGGEFLDHETFQRRLSWKTSQYYRRLATSAINRRGPAYWDFHREGLASVGMPLDQRRLARGIAREVLSHALCPREVIAVLARSFRGGMTVDHFKSR